MNGVRSPVLSSFAALLLVSPHVLAQHQNLDAVIDEVLEETEEVEGADAEEVASPSAPVAPTAPPVAPPLPPQPAQAGRPGLIRGDTVSNIQFPNADVRHVLAFYEQLTGKHAIYDNTVQGQINIVVNRPVSRDEAVQIIETALMINGFTIVPGPGERVVKVAGANKNARQFAVPILSDIADLPDGDQVVTFIFKLDYTEPTEVQQALSQYIAASPYTVIIPMPKTQALMITESATVLRMVGRLIDALDQPPAEVISEFITLERADAKEVVEKLIAMFEKPENTQTALANPFLPPWAQPPGGAAGQGGNQPGAAGAAAGTNVALSEDSLIIGKIKLTADERTNRIHVVTRPVNIPFIRQLIAEYDANVAYGEPSRRELRYVAAGEVLDVIVSALIEPGVKVDENLPAGTASNVSRTTPTSTSGGGSSGSGVNLGTEELAVRDLDVIPEARTVGNTRIIADKRANAIIVLGSFEAKEKIFRVLDQIDVRSPQVMLTAVIGELVLDDGEEFGVDYIYSLGRTISRSVTADDGTVTTTTTRPNAAFAGISRNTGVSLTDLAKLTTVSAFTGAPGGLTAFIGATDSLDIIVHALESTGKFRITSRPMVFTSNNKKAIITSGQQIAVPTNTTSGFTGGSDSLVTTSSIQYKDVVLKLEVVPLINSDSEVTLDIVQEVNSISGATEISGNVIPTISARKIKTTVSVANEATIALGGLVQESHEKDNSGIPILHKLPVVGPLFGSKKNTKQRTELIVLLRPTVTHDPIEAVNAAERAQEKLDFPPDLEATLDASSLRDNANPAPGLVTPKQRPRPVPTPRLRPRTHH